MINTDEFSIPSGLKASFVSVVCDKFEGHKTQKETDASLRELHELARTLGLERGESYTQTKKKMDPATVLGSGKLEEIAMKAKEEGSEFLIFDFELTSSQVRNIKKMTSLGVIDRVNVILEIFAKHAKTREAKIQIEISRLQYILPRLSSLWSHLGRQKGGIGVRGGEGEQQIELDRRMIRERIEFCKKQLVDIEKSRIQQRKKRQSQVVTAALVGYTNAGKSSVMNRLCNVDVLEEDKLFATLDSTYRTLNPDSKPPMVLIDTVGFISNLPSTLVQGFKTTLESALEADLLVLIIDISDPQFKKHIEVTKDVLSQLGVNQKDILYIFNKKDLLSNPLTAKITLRNYPNSFLISSYDKMDMKNLRSHIINYFLEKQAYYDLFIPYQSGEAHAKVIGNTNMLSQINHEKGIFYRIRVPDFIFHNLQLNSFVLGPEDPLTKELKELEELENARS